MGAPTPSIQFAWDGPGSLGAGQDGYALCWDSAAGRFGLVAKAATAHTHAPSDLSSGGASSGQALVWNGSAWAPGSAGVTDHGTLSGLADDDHGQYLVLAPGTSARNMIQPAGAAVSALYFRAASGQTANLSEYQNSSGTVIGYRDAYGRIAVKPTTWNSNEPLLLLQKTAADPQGGFYPNFITCKNSAGSTLFYVNWQGSMSAAGLFASGVGFDLQLSGGGNFRIRDGSSNTLLQATHGGGGYVTNAGTKRIEWDSTGLAFFAGATAAKQTVSGSRGGNAALESLLTALAAYGLITNSSSA